MTSLLSTFLFAFDAHSLPTLNALLNATATALLIYGYVLIKQRRETAHKRAMIAALVMSVLFLASYLVHHSIVLKETGSGSVPFGGAGAVRYVYYAILIPHVILAAAVPFLALATIYLGLRDRRDAHRRLAWWTFPIWLYVSVTGVVIYLMVYHLYPAAASQTIMAGP